MLSSIEHYHISAVLLRQGVFNKETTVVFNEKSSFPMQSLFQCTNEVYALNATARSRLLILKKLQVNSNIFRISIIQNITLKNEKVHTDHQKIPTIRLFSLHCQLI